MGAGPVSYQQGFLQLEAGSLVVLYTDGLVETRTGNIDERIDRAADMIRQWTGDLDGLPPSLVGELCPSGSSDDVAILAFRMRPVGPFPVSETSIPSDLTGPASARRFATEAAAGWTPHPVTGDLELLVSELVTNAIVHGDPPVRLRLTHLGYEVLIEVDDGAATPPRRRRATAADAHGRGLHTMAMLAVRSGVSVQSGGKTVWCTVPVV